MRYRTFKKGKDGTQHYQATSTSLGDGSRELAIIKESHKLDEGDLIYINDAYYEVTEDSFCHLSMFDTDRVVDGEHWGERVAKRLYRKITAAGG